MSTHISVPEFARLTREAVLHGDWDQGRGYLVMQEPDHTGCCIGSKLCMALVTVHPLSRYKHEHVEGIQRSCSRLGITEDQLEQLFQFVIQWSELSFGVKEWPITREEAWERLLLIEHIPSVTLLSTDENRLHIIRVAYYEANKQHWPLGHRAWTVFQLDKVEVPA